MKKFINWLRALLPKRLVSMRMIVELPENEMACGIVNFDGRLLVLCRSGRVYELKSERVGPHGEEYMVICRGFNTSLYY